MKKTRSKISRDLCEYNIGTTLPNGISTYSTVLYRTVLFMYRIKIILSVFISKQVMLHAACVFSEYCCKWERLQDWCIGKGGTIPYCWRKQMQKHEKGGAAGLGSLLVLHQHEVRQH